MPGDLAAAAERIRAEATSVLTDLAAGSTMCAIGRSGRSFPAAKYHEGRAAAAALVQRALRSEPRSRQALATAGRQWARTSPALLRRGPDGQAYGAGGDDVLDELSVLVGTDDAAPPA